MQKILSELFLVLLVLDGIFSENKRPHGLLWEPQHGHESSSTAAQQDPAHLFLTLGSSNV